MRRQNYESVSEGGEPLQRTSIQEDTIVAFNGKYGRGVAQMKGGGNAYYSAYNLEAKNETTLESIMPQEIELLDPTMKDYLLAIDKLDISPMLEDEDSDNYCPPSEFMMPYIYARYNRKIEEVFEFLDFTVSDIGDIYEQLIFRLKRDINQCNKTIHNQQEQIRKLKLNSKETFIHKEVEAAKKLFKHDKSKVDVLRQLFDKMGLKDAERELDAWIDSNEKPIISIENAGDVITGGGTKIVKNIRSRK